VVADHKNLFGVSASWDYFEAGHGKGPCDGLGGVAKRMADLAVKQNRSIQDAEDFFNWGKQSSKSISYMFVSTEEVAKERMSLESFTQNTDTCKGTMKIHAVHPAQKNIVLTRSTSCYCQLCLSGVMSQCCWSQSDLTKKTSIKPDAQRASTQLEVRPTPGDYVAAMYQKNWYIGLVRDIDNDAQDCLVTFMDRSTKLKKSFKWPHTPDELWVKFEAILSRSQLQLVALEEHLSLQRKMRT
jgi:hypothetical protein